MAEPHVLACPALSFDEVRYEKLQGGNTLCEHRAELDSVQVRPATSTREREENPCFPPSCFMSTQSQLDERGWGVGHTCTENYLEHHIEIPLRNPKASTPGGYGYERLLGVKPSV